MQAPHLIFIVVLIISIILHEVAHGYAADKLGDPTARLQGRLSLNPLVHLDWIGSVFLPALLIISGAPFIFGWAKPVPFNPYNFKNPRWGSVIVALAGPLTNILLAIIGSLILFLIPFGVEGTLFFTSFIIINIVLAVFNLLPIPPLDGHHVLFALISDRFIALKETLRRYSLIILILFLIYGWHLISPIILSLSYLLIP